MCFKCTKVDNPNAKLKGSTKGGIAKGKVCKGTLGKGKKPQVTMDCSTNKKSMQWFQGIMSCDQTTPPNHDQHDKDWKLVLNIKKDCLLTCEFLSMALNL